MYMKDKLYKMMNWPEIEAIVYGEEGMPQTILGRHSVSGYTLFQTFQPDSKNVKLVIEDDKEYSMEMADEEGFYAIAILGKVKGSYHYIVTDLKGKKRKVEDPYDFMPSMKDDDIKSFNDGTMYDAYEFMGAHVEAINKVQGTTFRVWAPNAIRVSVIGEFNNWNGKSHPMMKDEQTGIFSLFIPGILEGTEYKYELSVKGGLQHVKRDPYSASSISGSSIVANKTSYKWKDDEYFASKKKHDRHKDAFAVYEADIVKLDEEGILASVSRIDKFAKSVSDKGYGYIKLIRSYESLFDMPSSVTDDQLREFVDHMHIEGLGVIVDWNPCGFSLSDEGMQFFDGTYLYGHLDDRRRYNPACDGYNYNYGRPQVDDYLLSNAHFWMKEFHFDGLFIKGLSSILYLDYGKYEGEWTANIYGGHENLEAIEFIKHMNSIIHKTYPYAITITKEEGAFPRITEALDSNGLGFDYICNNGYSEDYLEFLKSDGGLKNINRITDNMAYAYSENYLLTISKDDVVAALDYDFLKAENDGTYWDYIPVDDAGKAAVKRATLGFMYAHPGKKLLFMGQDDDVMTAKLNELYRNYSALYSLDCNPYGFEWIQAMNRGDGVIAFIRKDEYLNHSVLVVCNFSDKEYAEYTFGMPYEGKYKMIFTSDDKKWGGKSAVAARARMTEEEPCDGKDASLTLKIAPMSVSYYAYTPYTEEELLKQAEQKVARYKAKIEEEARAKAKELKSKTGK